MRNEDPDFHDAEPLPLPKRHRKLSRLSRAVSVPGLAGVAVFVVAVVIAIVMTALAPHESGEANAAGVAELATAGESTGEGGAGDEAPGILYVHVVGEVAAPGVVELPRGSRVADALEAAGGATPSAVLDGVNLARVVADGEQIVVPDVEQPSTGATVPPGTASSAPGASLVNLNTADQSALETLPRVGPSLAQRIIAWRESNGPFTSVDQLLDVSGIGEKTLEGFRELVTV